MHTVRAEIIGGPRDGEYVGIKDPTMDVSFAIPGELDLYEDVNGDFSLDNQIIRITPVWENYRWKLYWPKGN